MAKTKAKVKAKAVPVPIAADETILITATIMPLTGKKIKKRNIIISAARAGCLPHTLTGEFPELHQLITEAYSLAMKDQIGAVANKQVHHGGNADADKLPNVDQTLTAKEDD